MENISFADFKKLEIRIGKIVVAERVQGSEKLLKLSVDFGTLGQRQIIAGIGLSYQPEDLQGKESPFAFNLEPRALMGLESQGMILCADDQGPVLMSPEREILPGSGVK